MSVLENTDHEIFAVKWAIYGDPYMAYFNTQFTEDMSERDIEVEARTWSQLADVIARRQELLNRAEQLKSHAVKVDVADLTRMLKSAYNLADRLGKPGDMVKSVLILNKIYGLDPLTKATIERYGQQNKTDEASLDGYSEVLKKLADSLPD